LECNVLASKWEQLENTLNISFQTPHLLKQAFTHASYRNEHRRPTIEDNERLEFLGDAVLELVVSDYLYRSKPEMPEGELTRFRAAIVCEPSLVRFAKMLNFHEYVRLGRGEERSGGRTRPALLADVFEAFIGALYLDQGLAAVQAFAERYIFPHVQDPKNALNLDYKTTLQEWVQQHHGAELRYDVVEERGPAHAKEFVVQVRIDQEVLGTATGRSKKEAEQRAAKEALVKLQQDSSHGRT
jgi:ribonuclease III